MAAIDRTLLRAARDICRQLARTRQPREEISLPDSAWQRVACRLRQLDQATAHGWPAAARYARQGLVEAVADCSGRLKGLLDRLETRCAAVAGLRDIYDDLLALKREFAEVQVEPAQHTLSVTTEPIMLDSVALGPFRIVLDYQQLPAPQAYRIVALQPRPAASAPTVTHPHVQEERLCAGDGHVPIQAALAQGRLLDFFLLVARVLQTYARGNAYVELDQWEGVPCRDCGALSGPEECSRCATCEGLVCSDCVLACEGCGEALCSGCLDRCPHCEADRCSACRARCGRCARQACPCCLDENALCQECHDAQTTPSQARPAQPPSARSAPAARGS